MRNLLQHEDADIASGNVSVAQFFQELEQYKNNDCLTVYADAGYDTLAVVVTKDIEPRNAVGSAALDSKTSTSVPFLLKFVSTKSAALSNMTDNVWQGKRK